MNLVLGLSSGYTYPILKPLIKSLKATGFDGEVVLFISSTSERTRETLKGDGVILINYNAEYPYFNEDGSLVKYIPPELEGKFLSPNSLRYVLYNAYLMQNPDKYKWILHTDTRDVIFQREPFSYYTKAGLYSFLEDESFKIKDSIHNAYWIKFGFGDDLFEQMKEEPISCSGVTLGSRDAFADYLSKMVSHILALPNTGGLDQGIHNYLIFTKEIKDLHLIKDDEGPVTTLTTFKPYNKIKFNKKGQLIDRLNEPFNIVHQYDRHLSLLWRFNKSAFFEKSINMGKRSIIEFLARNGFNISKSK